MKITVFGPVMFAQGLTEPDSIQGMEAWQSDTSTVASKKSKRQKKDKVKKKNKKTRDEKAIAKKKEKQVKSKKNKRATRKAAKEAAKLMAGMEAQSDSLSEMDSTLWDSELSSESLEDFDDAAFFETDSTEMEEIAAKPEKEKSSRKGFSMKKKPETFEENPNFFYEMAKEDLMERFPDAVDVRTPDSEEWIVFTYWTNGAPAFSTYDHEGLWVASVKLINNNQMPAGTRRVVKDLGMYVDQFEDKVKIQTRDIPRPVFMLMTSSNALVMNEGLQTETGLAGNLVSGVRVNGLDKNGKYFIIGNEIREVPLQQLGFASIVLSADGVPTPNKDIQRLLANDLFIFPNHYETAFWRPDSDWSPNDLLTGKSSWEPEFNRWYPDEDWFVESLW